MRLNRCIAFAFLCAAACGGKIEGEQTSPVNVAPGGGSTTTDPPPSPTTSGGGAGTGSNAGGSVAVTAPPAGVGGSPAMGTGGGTDGGAPSICDDLRRHDSPCIECGPGISVGWQCVACDDPKTSAAIGPEGGVVSMMDAAGAKDGVPFSLTIPPGALAQSTTITITERVIPPARFAPTTRGYQVEPRDLTFAAPVALRVPWGQTTAATQAFSIYTARDECSEPARLADSYVNAGFLQGTTRRLGVFFAGTPNGPPLK